MISEVSFSRSGFLIIAFLKASSPNEARVAKISMIYLPEAYG